MKLEENTDQLDKAGIMQSLGIFKMEENPKEGTREEVLKIINSKMFLYISSRDIQLCYHIGKRTDDKLRRIYPHI